MAPIHLKLHLSELAFGLEGARLLSRLLRLQLVLLSLTFIKEALRWYGERGVEIDP